MEVLKERQCVACDSKTTGIDGNGKQIWQTFDGDTYCKSCYAIYIWNPILNVLYHEKNNPRRITFKGKRVHLKGVTRTGECQKCNNKIGDEYTNNKGKPAIIKRTHMHHIVYDENNPSANTIELCVSCHRKEHKK